MRNLLLVIGLLLVALVPNLRLEIFARPEVAPQLGALIAGSSFLLLPILVLVLLRGEHEALARPFFAFLALDVLALIVSTVFGLDPQAAFWGRFDRALGAWTHLAAVLTGLALYLGIGRSRRRLFITLVVIAAASFPVSLRGAVERAETGQRIISTIGNANHLANYLLLPTVLALGLAASFVVRGFAQRRAESSATDGRGANAWWAAGALLGLVFTAGVLSIRWTGTLGAWLGLAAGAIVFAGFALFASPRAQGRRRLLALPILAVLVALMGGDTWSRVLSRLEKAGQDTVDAGSLVKASNRVMLWKTTLAAVPGSMLVGAGAGNFRLAFTPHKTVEIAYGAPNGMWTDAHDMPLTILVERGLLGLIAYAGMVFLFFRSSFSAFRRSSLTADRLWLAGLISAYAAFTVHNLTTGAVVPTVLYHYALLLLGIRCGALEPGPREGQVPLVPARFHQVAFAALVGLSLALAWFGCDYASRVWRADRDVRRSVAALDRAAEAQDEPQRLKILQRSEESAKRAAELIPFEGKYQWNRSSVLVLQYYASGRDLRYLSDAIKTARAALRWTHNPGMATQLARLYVTAGDQDRARAVLQESVRYDPYYYDTRHDLARLLEAESRYGDAMLHAEALSRIARGGGHRKRAAELLERIRGALPKK